MRKQISRKSDLEEFASANLTIFSNMVAPTLKSGTYSVEFIQTDVSRECYKSFLMDGFMSRRFHAPLRMQEKELPIK